MKKLIALALLLSSMILFFTSCDRTLFHKHIVAAEWSCDKLTHHKGVRCTWDICKFDIALVPHSDADADRVCDVCAYVIEHEHIELGIDSTEEYHCNVVVCTWNSCDIDSEPISHFDADFDGFCDDCGYVMHGYT